MNFDKFMKNIYACGDIFKNLFTLGELVEMMKRWGLDRGSKPIRIEYSHSSSNVEMIKASFWENVRENFVADTTGKNFIAPAFAYFLSNRDVSLSEKEALNRFVSAREPIVGRDNVNIAYEIAYSTSFISAVARDDGWMELMLSLVG